MRPGQSLVLFLGRLRQDFELSDRDGALPERRADAVRPRVASANHHHLLAFGEDRLDIALRLAGDAAVLLWQEIHGEMNAVKIATRYGKVARVLGAAGEQKSIIIAFELLHAH